MKIKAIGTKLPTATLVSNDFIDNYMAVANGEYVKVYLYVLRHYEEEITDERIADALDLTTADVTRAISYWNRAGLLSTESDEQVEEVVYEAAADAAGVKEEAADMIKLSNDDDFAELLYCLQKYLSRIFSQHDVEIVAYMYDVMKMPRELIEYLVEICVQKGKTSLRYIEAIAQDWTSKGIRTVEQAKAEGSVYATEVWGVMKAMGVSNRAPGNEEQALIRKWFHDFGFSDDIVYAACDRTLAATGKPSFKYADSILTRWHEAGVRSEEDIEKLDKAHASKSASANATGTYGGAKGKSKFANFDQRNDDIDADVLNKIRAKIN